MHSESSAAPSFRDRRHEMPAKVILRKFVELCPHRPDNSDLEEIVFSPEDAAVLRGDVGQVNTDHRGPRIIQRSKLNLATREGRDDAELLTNLSTAVSVNIARLLTRQPDFAIAMRVGDAENAEVRDALRERQWLEHPFARVWRKFMELKGALREANLPMLDAHDDLDETKMLAEGARPADWAERVALIAQALRADSEQIVYDLKRDAFGQEAVQMCTWILGDKAFEAEFKKALQEAASRKSNEPVVMSEILRAAERTMGKEHYFDNVALPASQALLPATLSESVGSEIMARRASRAALRQVNRDQGIDGGGLSAGL